MWRPLTDSEFCGEGKFLYSAVSKVQDCSKRFTLYSLADVFNRNHFGYYRKHPATFQLMPEDYSYTHIFTTVYGQVLIHTVLWPGAMYCDDLRKVWHDIIEFEYRLSGLRVRSLPMSHCATTNGNVKHKFAHYIECCSFYYFYHNYIGTTALGLKYIMGK